MASMTTVVGNLVNDVELRFTSSGKPFANLTVAVNDKRFNRQTNQYEDGDTWFARGTLWGEIAENVANSVTKGARVIGYGRIKQRDFETKDGDKRTTIEVEYEAFGVDLRFAVAQVTRKQGGSSQGGGFGGGAQQDWAQPSADTFGAPQGGFGAPPADDPWNTEKPF